VHDRTYKDREEFLNNFESLLGFFKKEKVVQSGFFAVISGRKFIFAFILVILNNHPNLELILLCILCISMMLILYSYKPYESKLYFFRDYIQEIGFISTHIVIIN
jgi:hypothetical protein